MKSKTKPVRKSRQAVSANRRAFEEVLQLIQSARQRAYQAINFELVALYWQIGNYIHAKLESSEWGDKVVAELADYLARTQPGLRGFTIRNLFRMRQFYETYRGNQIVSPLVSQLPWTHHLIILSRCKYAGEREFYIHRAIREKWGKRELERQINSGLFERAAMEPPQGSARLQEIHPGAADIFKDAYSLEFLGLQDHHSESDLHGALLCNLRRFIIELGRDFCFVGSEYPIQVGNQDFSLDLLFFHRGLNCLVAVELKAVRFEPEYLGKLNFYLEALDRNVRKPHENPSIGLLLCATKDSEVVEYALSRSLSPAMIAEYETRLPDKRLLQTKLQETYRLLAPPEEEKTPVAKKKAKPRKRQHRQRT
jgi:predicted nuclease of restriction endonuclease-like (RecB) superfamily